MRSDLISAVVVLGLLLGGCGSTGSELPAATWEEIVAQARGHTVTWAMWQGDPYINAYVKDFVAPRLRDRFDITINVVGGQGAQITALLMTELEARKTPSAVDMVWINGETFYQLRRLDALYGPYTQLLPNARFIDWNNRFIRYDFQQEIQGYECPWGNVQMTIIYDRGRVPDPPRTRESLAAWVRAHPGRFTFDTSFTGMTFLKSLLIDIAGDEQALAGPYDSVKYERSAARLWEYLNGLKAHFWREGKAFPASVAQLHQLFAAGELDFTMSNNDGEVDNKVLQGLFPETARAYVLDSGTIQNSHYIGIVKHAPNRSAALVTVNFLISPEAQLEKLAPGVWGDGTVLDLSTLPPDWRAKFESVPGRRFAPLRSEIQSKALEELAPEYMIHLYDDFRRHVIE